MKRQFKFTKKLIDALPPCPPNSTSKEVEYSDQDIAGLRLQVNRLGRKFFLFRYQHQGRKRSMKIGGYPEVAIDDARQQVIEWRSMLLKGIDPQDKRDEDTKAGLTFRQFWDGHLKPHVVANKRSAKADISRIAHVLAKFGDREMAKITPMELQQFHNENLTVKKLAPASCNRIFELVRRSYNLCCKVWGLLPESDNHAKGIRLFRENNKSERYLSEPEISRLMQALDKASNQTIADAIRLLLASGCRKSEIFNLRVEHLRLEEESLYIPTPKSGRGRHVVLNAVALEIVKRRLPLATNGFLFESHRIPGHPINNATKAWLAILREAEIDHRTTTLHCLRHTHAALLTRNCSLHEIAGILGHSHISTSQRYAHLQQGQLARKSALVAEIMQSSRGTARSLAG